MSTESEIITTDERPYVAPCPMCREDTPTSYVIKGYDPEGNVADRIATDLCSDCRAEVNRRVAAREAATARIEAIAEKKRAEIFSRIPKQMDLNMDLG